MTTKREVESLIHKVRGKSARLREHKGAPTPDRRQVLREQQDANKARIAEIEPILKSLIGHAARLLKAAEFVCDVNGDAPSIDQLREAAAASRQFTELSDERQDLKYQNQKLGGEIMRRRWDCATYFGHPFPHECVEDCSDTLEEMAEKLRAKLSPKSAVVSTTSTR